MYHRNHDLLIRTDRVSYDGENDIAGCLLMFLILRHHKALSTERINDYVNGLKKEGIDYASGWASAVLPGFSHEVKSQKLPLVVSVSSKKAKPHHADLNFKDLEKEMTAKRQHFVDEQ